MAQYDTLISYLIEKKEDSIHSFVKKRMEEKGYFDAFIVTDRIETHKIVFLPHTTLWKPKTTNKTAFEDLRACIAEYVAKTNVKHKLEKCIATKFTNTSYALGKNATSAQIKKYPIKEKAKSINIVSP